MSKRINLLPAPRQLELANEKVLYSVSVAATLGVVLLLLGVLAQFGVRLYITHTMDSVSLQIEQLKGVVDKSENANVKKQIQLANAQISDFAKLSSQTPEWSSVVAAFLNDVPHQVVITQLTADTVKQEIMIRGYSPTRESVIDLYNNINADKDHFLNINYPLENVAQPVNVSFNFTFNVVPSVLSQDGAKAEKK